MRIGWIGLGAMGGGMAGCAARAGFRVTGHDRGGRDHGAFVAAGGVLSGDLGAVAGDADIVCVNVFDEAQLRDLIDGQGLMARIAPGASLVIHTTSDPALSRALQAAAPAGIELVDGAFSGSPDQAARGELTLMAGGGAAFARVRPLFESYAGFLRHVGPLGAGMEIKLLNNLLFAAHVRLAEAAYAIAARQGIAAETAMEVLMRGSGSSCALGIVGAGGRIEDNLAAMRRYVDKDVATVRASAAAAGVDLGLVGAVASGAG